MGDVGETGDRSESAANISDWPIVRMEAPSSNSEISDKVDRSENELNIEPPLVETERIVSASESVVDKERDEDAKDDVDDVRSDPDVDDVASPMSCLCELQCIVGIAV